MQRSGIRLGAGNYAREPDPRIGLCATDRRRDGPEVLARLHRKPTQVFVCGSNGFVNIATEGALLAGLDPSIVKTERYGG